jgi:glycine cleavage system H protein
MSGDSVPDDRRYTKSHEWVREVGEEILIGITDHAQSELTDIVFVELPAVGKATTAGSAVLVLESVKTVADVYAPVNGAVTAVNGQLKTHPELVNKDPYGEGWLVRIRPGSAFDGSGLLDAAGYRAAVAAG